MSSYNRRRRIVLPPGFPRGKIEVAGLQDSRLNIKPNSPVWRKAIGAEVKSEVVDPTVTEAPQETNYAISLPDFIAATAIGGMLSSEDSRLESSSSNRAS